MVFLVLNLFDLSLARGVFLFFAPFFCRFSAPANHSVLLLLYLKQIGNIKGITSCETNVAVFFFLTEELLFVNIEALINFDLNVG